MNPRPSVNLDFVCNSPDLYIESVARTIAVSDEVYNLLKKSKMPSESFSRLIKRNLQKKGKLSDIIGSKTIGSDDWEAVRVYLTKAQQKTIRELTGR